MNDELIRVVQLPVIEEQLRTAKAAVEQAVSDAMSLVCTEDTIQTVKATRSELNKQFSALEEQRKAVKAAVMEPYNRFEEIYKECVSEPFKRADADLKGKISDVEREIKQRCDDNMRDYFSDLCQMYHVDFIQYEQAGIIVDMASAKQKRPNKLMAQVHGFVCRTANDVEAIGGMDNSDEILAEYKQTLNLSAAIAAVNERHRAIDQAAKEQAARETAKAQEAEAVKRVEHFAPPEVVKAPEKVLRLTFTVTDTKPRLRLLKQWLDANGYKYE